MTTEYLKNLKIVFILNLFNNAMLWYLKLSEIKKNIKQLFIHINVSEPKEELCEEPINGDRG